MYTYYYIIAAAVVAVFLFLMWRDVRTLKSRVTDVVEQHNNVKKALDRHESLLAPHDIPVQFAMESENTDEPTIGETVPAEVKSKQPVEIKTEPEDSKPAKAKKTK
jgi:hypothetical protein